LSIDAMVALADRTARWVWPLTWPLSSLPPCSNTARAGKLVYCMFHVYHGPSTTRDLCHLFGILGKGIEWIDAPAPRGWAAGTGEWSTVEWSTMFHVYQARNPIHLFEEARERGRIGRGCTRWVPFTRQRARVLYRYAIVTPRNVGKCTYRAGRTRVRLYSDQCALKKRVPTKPA